MLIRFNVVLSFIPGYIFGLMINPKHILTVISLFLTGLILAQGHPNKAIADKIVAVVGDNIILKSDIKNIISDAIRYGKEIPADAECLLLEQAIVTKVLSLQAQKDSLPVTDKDVEMELQRRIDFYNSSARQDEPKLALDMLPGDVKASVKENMLADAMQEKITGKTTVTPSEVKSFYDKIPRDSLPFFESQYEVGQIIVYWGENKQPIARLDSVRAKLIAGAINFNSAALKYSEAESVKFNGAFFLNREGLPYVLIDQLDKETVALVSKMKAGELSQPVSFTSQDGKKGARIIYLKSISPPHSLNLRNDYAYISHQALEQKESGILEKWLKAKLPTYSITVYDLSNSDCPRLQKFANRNVVGK